MAFFLKITVYKPYFPNPKSSSKRSYVLLNVKKSQRYDDIGSGMEPLDHKSGYVFVVLRREAFTSCKKKRQNDGWMVLMNGWLFFNAFNCSLSATSGLVKGVTLT